MFVRNLSFAARETLQDFYTKPLRAVTLVVLVAMVLLFLAVGLAARSYVKYYDLPSHVVVYLGADVDADSIALLRSTLAGNPDVVTTRYVSRGDMIHQIGNMFERRLTSAEQRLIPPTIEIVTHTHSDIASISKTLDASGVQHFVDEVFSVGEGPMAVQKFVRSFRFAMTFLFPGILVGCFGAIVLILMRLGCEQKRQRILIMIGAGPSFGVLFVVVQGFLVCLLAAFFVVAAVTGLGAIFWSKEYLPVAIGTVVSWQSVGWFVTSSVLLGSLSGAAAGLLGAESRDD